MDKYEYSNTYKKLFGAAEAKLSEKAAGKHGKDLCFFILKYILKGIFLSVLSYVLSLCPTVFSAKPLGIALCCSAQTNCLFIFFGCLLSVLSHKQTESLAFLFVYLFIIASRAVISKWLCDREEYSKIFSEPYSVGIFLSVISAFFIGLYVCFSESFSLFSLGSLLVYIVVSSGMSFLFDGIYEKGEENDSFRYLLALSAYAFCLVLAASKYSIFGYTLGFSVACAVSVYSAYKFGVLQSGMIALLAGTACSEPALAPMYAIIALSCSAIRRIKNKYAIPVSLLLGSAYAFIVFGQKALTYIIPDTAGGLVLLIPFYIFTRQREAQNKEAVSKEPLRYSENNTEAIRNSEIISENMHILSETLSSLSDKLRCPDLSEVRNICDRICDKQCGSCLKTDKCYAGLSYKDSELRKKISSYLYETGYIIGSDLPEDFIRNCKKNEAILDSINREYGQVLKKRMTEDRTKAFAVGYGCVSKLISEGLRTLEEESSPDRSMTEKIVKEFEKLKITAGSITVTGNRIKKLSAIGVGDEISKIGGDTIRKRISELLSGEMTMPLIEYTDSGERKMIMKSKALLSVNSCSDSLCKYGETICGDTVNSFSSNDGYFYSVISDGMGSGRQAALVSRICCTFAEKLTLSGGSMKTVVDTVNNYLINQEYECSSTMDFLRIDKYTKSATFVKCGAASSMVVRNGHIFKIDAHTVPLGSVYKLNAEQIVFPIEDGDIIVMMSDGIASNLKSTLTIADIMTKAGSKPLSGYIDEILSSVNRDSDPKDDMSIILVEIGKG